MCLYSSSSRDRTYYWRAAVKMRKKEKKWRNCLEIYRCFLRVHTPHRGEREDDDVDEQCARCTHGGAAQLKRRNVAEKRFFFSLCLPISFQRRAFMLEAQQQQHQWCPVQFSSECDEKLKSQIRFNFVINYFREIWSRMCRNVPRLCIIVK